MTSPTIGRAQRGHRDGSIVPERLTPAQGSSTYAPEFGLAGLSTSVRSLTATLIAACPKPRDPSIASLRADVMMGKKEPLKHLLRLIFSAIDMGASVESATQVLDDAKALAIQYAGRRERLQGSGVLPFDQLKNRVAVTAIKEDAEADCCEQVMDENDVASLEKARTERLEAIEAEERKVELLTNRIAFLRAQG